MKLKEKAKRFFTMNAANHEGFTLVELIVVIAILAILAGVAVPAYSGYIKKAEKAGDMQLLGAVNEAFAAACMNEGTQASKISSASLKWNGNCVEGIASVSGADVNGINEAFQLFFKGNETSEFKVLNNKLAFRGGVFVDATSDYTTSYNGNSINVSGDNVAAYLDSNWGNVATSDVLGLVGATTDFASAVDNDTFLGMLTDPTYLNAAAAAIGVSADDYDATITGMLDDAEAKYRAENPDATDDDVAAYMDTVGGQIMANNAVLVAAQNASANKDSIIELLTTNNGTGAKAAIGAAMGSDPANGLAQASLAYGLYTSYMLSEDPNYDTTSTPDPLTVMNALDDEGFQEYLKSDTASTDLDGFMGALDTVASNSGNGVGLDIVENGFTDNAELTVLLQQIMGK